MKQFGKYLSALFLSLTLITAVGCASTSKQEGMGEYVDDSVLTAKVKAAIFEHPSLKSAEINVVETFSRTGARRQGRAVGQERHASEVSDVFPAATAESHHRRWPRGFACGLSSLAHPDRGPWPPFRR